MVKQEFVNSNSSIPNRRKIKIITRNSEDELIADIEHLDENKDGTRITREIYQKWEDNIHALANRMNAVEEIQNAQSNTIGDNGNSSIMVGGAFVNGISFSSDPQTQIDDLSQRVSGYDQTINNINVNYETLKTSLDGVPLALSNVTGQVTTVQDNFENLKSEVVRTSGDQDVSGSKFFKDGIHSLNLVLKQKLNKTETETEDNGVTSLSTITKVYSFIGEWQIRLNADTGSLEFEYAEDKKLESTSSSGGNG